MRCVRIAGVASLLAGAAALAAAAPAAAEFGPIHLVSRTVPEQAKEAEAPALSASGRYLAFQGTMDEGRKGVFRADLQTGVVTRVATGEPNQTGTTDARAPSISADGRYVSFTTQAPLDPVDDPQPSSEDVYVADMSTSPPTYELASALDGSMQAMSDPAQASPRVALSADGRKVAFVSGGQVYLRDLDTRETTLVSVERDPQTGAMEPGAPVPGGAVIEVPQLPHLTGAALSADGTTVAWLGTHLPAQVPTLADEEQAISQADASSRPYDEPLWRRVADGPLAPTRRIIGGGDPLAPGCPTGGTFADPDCLGPFPDIASRSDRNFASGWLGAPSERIDGIPQLSADGRTVALIGGPNEASNVFLVNMAAGLSRVQAVRQLTTQVAIQPGDEGSVVNVEPYVPLNGYIYDLAISPDGERIAFTTARQRFPLAPPNLITAPPTQIGLVELYVLNLENESLQRVTRGYASAGEPSLAPLQDAISGNGTAAPSFGAGGHLIGFSSTAANLVEGDGNEASDVFVIEDPASSRAKTTTISQLPPAPAAKRRRRLVLSAFSLPSGKVRLVAVAPSSGSLRARATASLDVGAPPKHLLADRARASANKVVAMILALPRRYRRLAHSQEGLYATVRVSFHSATEKQLHGELQIRFHAHPRADRRNR